MIIEGEGWSSQGQARYQEKELMIRLERLSRMLMSIHRDDWKLKIGFNFIHY